MTWSINTTGIMKKAQQTVHFLRMLTIIIEHRICLYSSITAPQRPIDLLYLYVLCWFCSCTAADRKALQSIVTLAQKINWPERRRSNFANNFIVLYDDNKDILFYSILFTMRPEN